MFNIIVICIALRICTQLYLWSFLHCKYVDGTEWGGEQSILFYSEMNTLYMSSLLMHTNYVWKEFPTVSSKLLSSLPSSALLGSVTFPVPRLLFICSVSGCDPMQRVQSILVYMEFLYISWVESFLSLSQQLSTECLLLGWLHVENWSWGDPCLHSGTPLSLFD